MDFLGEVSPGSPTRQLDRRGTASSAPVGARLALGGGAGRGGRHRPADRAADRPYRPGPARCVIASPTSGARCPRSAWLGLPFPSCCPLGLGLGPSRPSSPSRARHPAHRHQRVRRAARGGCRPRRGGARDGDARARAPDAGRGAGCPAVILAGFRTSAVQVVATATLAAVVGGGTLGQLSSRASTGDEVRVFGARHPGGAPRDRHRDALPRSSAPPPPLACARSPRERPAGLPSRSEPRTTPYAARLPGPPSAGHGAAGELAYAQEEPMRTYRTLALGAAPLALVMSACSPGEGGGARRRWREPGCQLPSHGRLGGLLRVGHRGRDLGPGPRGRRLHLERQLELGARDVTHPGLVDGEWTSCPSISAAPGRPFEGELDPGCRRHARGARDSAGSGRSRRLRARAGTDADGFAVRRRRPPSSASRDERPRRGRR